MKKRSMLPCQNYNWKKWCFYRWCRCRCDRTQTSHEGGTCTAGGNEGDRTDGVVKEIVALEEDDHVVVCATTYNRTWR